MGLAPNWTKEEERYLEDAWGKTSIPTIAKHLNRSIYAIKVRASRLQLGPWTQGSDYVTFQYFMSVLHGCDYHSSSCAWTVRLREAGIPVRKKFRESKYIEMIRINEFWDWCEQDYNRRMIDFSKLEENALGAEPDWVKQKRKIDFICRVSTEPWTLADDAKLRRMIDKYKYSYTDIATELRRSEGAVKRRLHDINIKGRPIRMESRAWTKEEEKQLMFLYMEGWSYEYIGSKLGRTGLGVRGKIEHIEHPEWNTRAFRRKENVI